MRYILVLLASIVFVVNAAAFEVNDIHFANKFRVLHSNSDSGDYPLRLEHFLVIRKHGFPLWATNLYQLDRDNDLKNRTQMRSTIGFSFTKNLAVIADRHEYSFKKTDDEIYRIGMEVSF